MLTNGHCYEGGMPSAGQVITNRASSRTFTLLNSSGQGSLGRLRASRLLYATMTDTDVSLYRLNTSYAAIERNYGTPALELSLDHPTAYADLRVVSGYWRRMYSCNLDGFAYRLREGEWTWKDSVRYTSSCDVIGGTSGSPVIDAASGKVIAVNNTINESGGRCTLNNPARWTRRATSRCARTSGTRRRPTSWAPASPRQRARLQPSGLPHAALTVHGTLGRTLPAEVPPSPAQVTPVRDVTTARSTTARSMSDRM